MFRPIKRNSSLVLMLTSIVWSLGVSRADPPHNLNGNQPKQHSTISSEISPYANQQAQNGIRSQAPSPDLVNLGDSIEDLMNEKYLDSSISGNQLDLATNLITRDEVTDKPNSLGSTKSHQGKTRRQMELQQKVTDWWNNLTSEGKAKRVGTEVKSNSKQPIKAPAKNIVYQEQPLDQNQLVTIRHQLIAIRDKHRLLMMKSVPQLMQLDQKLIDSYKLCFKRKMPLYAGMLYRTRDYVVRMANEIVHERRVLEAIAKQIQKVLRQKAQNGTLVRAYNRQLATIISLSTPEQSGSPTAKNTDLEPSPQYRAASGHTATPHDGNTFENELTGKQTRRTPLTKTPSAAVSLTDDGLKNETPVINDSAILANQKALIKARDSEGEEYKDELDQGEKQVAADPSQHAINNIEQASSGSADDKYASKFKHFARKSSGENQRPFGDLTSIKGVGDDQLRSTGAPRKSKQRFYTVNINEVNLKRELAKAQALIDRVNASSHELMAVVDDIVYLFKLTSENQNSMKNISVSARRLKKMMLKSPIQSFLERQGKLMNMLSPSDMKSNNLSEMKPIFETLSFTSYKDPIDADLGFDSPAILDT